MEEHASLKTLSREASLLRAAPLALTTALKSSWICPLSSTWTVWSRQLLLYSLRPRRMVAVSWLMESWTM